ncbi:pilus assembly protein TadG-related protein [Agromyces bauzanensis]
MRKLRELTPDETGNVTLPLIVLVVAFMLFIGLVVDGSGKIQAGDQANQIASAAARAAANSLTGEAVLIGGVGLDGVKAQNTAQSVINAAGVNGTASVSGNTVTVTVSVDYSTIFLNMIGINTLTGQGTASARLIDG